MAREKGFVVEVRNDLYTIFDVYNTLKVRRDTLSEILRMAEWDKRIVPDVVTQLGVEAAFLTNTLARIDRGLDRPTENEQ